jgi:hypothetical protein
MVEPHHQSLPTFATKSAINGHASRHPLIVSEDQFRWRNRLIDHLRKLCD